MTFLYDSNVTLYCIYMGLLALTALWVLFAFIPELLVHLSLLLLVVDLRHADTACCNPEEVVLPELIDLLEEGMEPNV